GAKKVVAYNGKKVTVKMYWFLKTAIKLHYGNKNSYEKISSLSYPFKFIYAARHPEIASSDTTPCHIFQPYGATT
ncbi:hypothetical protein, partial [Bacteroides rodentium]